MSKFKVFTPTNGCERLVTLQLSPVYETGEITFSPLRIIFIERISIVIRSKELLLHMAGEIGVPGGARSLDPVLKRHVLYQLSYGHRKR